MTTYTFGTDVDAAAFFEFSDGLTNPPPRPGTSAPLKVRNSVDHTALPDSTIEAITGYWNLTTDDVPLIDVSGDNGASWHPQIAIEAQIAGANAGQVAADASSTATLAASTAASAAALAQQALDAATGGGGGGGGGTVSKVAGKAPDSTGNVPLTPADISARPTASPVPAAQVSGLAPVSTSGSYNDLSNIPPNRDLDQIAVGSWPDRPATSKHCTFWGLSGATDPPPTTGSTAGGPGMIPNFDVYVQMP